MRPGAVLAWVTVAVAAGAAGGGWTYGYGPLARHGDPAAAPPVPMSTTVVRRGTLTVSEQDPGTIGYADPVTVYSAQAGTVTWLPPAGTVIGRARPLYAVDGQAVIALFGQVPAWRTFSPGMTDGTDVRELQRNLIALGYDPYHQVTADGGYGWATEAAVERWQEALGMAASGVIPLGQIAFVPGTARVSAVASGAGAMVSPGTQLLTITSTTPLVTIALPATEAGSVRPGDPVTITLPSGSTVAGRILPASAATSTSPAAPGGSAPTSGGSAGAQTMSVPASISAPAAGLDGASVQVTIATQAQPGALIVPISALLATPGGSYQVTVVSGGGTRNVTVSPGSFDDIDGTVAITGAGIGAGTRVEVPSAS